MDQLNAQPRKQNPDEERSPSGSAKDMPFLQEPFEEKVIRCKLSALQRHVYKQVAASNRLIIINGRGSTIGVRGMSCMIMCLRKICNHPFAFGDIEDQINPTLASNDLLWRTSGKFELLDRILPKYQRIGRRVLILFQMTCIMDIMEDFLRFRGIQYLRLDGTAKPDDYLNLPTNSMPPIRHTLCSYYQHVLVA